jgi:rubredoxin
MMMRCPECGASGYSRQTKTPEWRCRKCGHEWDKVVTEPIQLFDPGPQSGWERVFEVVMTIVVVSMVVIVVYGCATTGFPDFTGDDDGYKEECRIEDRGGRIREVCW